jgi:hypothetical protein
MRPLPQWVLAVSVYRKSDLAFFITGFSQCRDRLVKCLSRVMGNYHARFLGDGVAAMPLCYPTFLLIVDTATFCVNSFQEKPKPTSKIVTFTIYSLDTSIYLCLNYFNVLLF